VNYLSFSVEQALTNINTLVGILPTPKRHPCRLKVYIGEDLNKAEK
jgi:hypothetical protein